MQRIIRPSGFYRNKAKALHELFSWLHMYHFDYEHIAHLFDKRLRDELLAIKGIGSETADVLMVYIFNGVEFILTVIHGVYIINWAINKQLAMIN